MIHRVTPPAGLPDNRGKHKSYGMLIDLDRCIGCHACQVTCKAEHDIPFGTFRCTVRTFQSGRYPDIRKLFIPCICNQCDNAPCIDACEEKDAIIKTGEGVVLINTERCPEGIDCKKCYEFCPHDAIDINPFTGRPEKCDFCYGRLQRGEEPVCVKSCMGKAIIFGDMNDEDSAIAALLKRRKVKVRNPEHETEPRVFYLLNRDAGSRLPVGDYEIPAGNVPQAEITGGRERSDAGSREGRAGAENGKLVHTADAMCPSECGISVLVQDGAAVKIYGNPRALVNNGALCAKGAAGLQLTYSPHRIKTPLKRAGERGEDRWEPVTWEEALDYTARKLTGIKLRHGPEAVFLDTGDMTDGIAYERLFRAFGTPNIYSHGCICDPNRRWGHYLMTGDTRPLPDVQRPVLTRNDRGEPCLSHVHDARLVLHIGVNPFVATRFNYVSAGIPAARAENNCKYIVVDPSCTSSAALADMWLRIIPGTDADLLAAMLYFIIKNDSLHYASRRYIDHDFIENHTVGWPGFRDAFLSWTGKKDPANNLHYFTPEWAEEKTGIPAADIEKVSHMFGITKPASIEVGMHGASHHTNGDVTSILMTALCLITGNIDRPGGLVLTGTHKPKKGGMTAGMEFLERTVTRRVNGRDARGRLSELHKDRYGDYPAAVWGVLTDLPTAMRQGVRLKHGPFRDYSYPVKAFITRGGNPVVTAGSTPDWTDALTSRDETGEYRVELAVCIDTHITVTGRYADIIFPEAGFLERMGLNSVYTVSPEIALRDRVIEPLHESKTPYDFMILLSEALARNGDPDVRTVDFSGRYKDEEDFINEQLSETPGLYNVGEPLPYPGLPEGCLITGAPDNPVAVLGDRVVREGRPLTVEWLRNNHGVAVWPAGYYRYRNSGGSPSGVCPETPSGKFEFRFGFVEEINRKFGTGYPVTFYWDSCKWNPKNPLFREIAVEYPFQLISGRVHHSMTMTVVCPYLAETGTECMEPLNDDFRYFMPPLGDIPNKSGLRDNEETFFRAGSVSIPVFAVNRTDGEKLRLATGDMIILENPLGKRIRGKAFLTEEIMPGVIKAPFGPGGQRARGLGFINNTGEYTANINELHDPENFNTITGTPGFGDIMVKVIKVQP